MNRTIRTSLRSLVVLGLVALLTAAGISEATAQRGPGGMRGPNIDRAMAYLTAELDLSAEQQTQIRPIMLEHFQQQQAILDERGGRGTGEPLYATEEMKQLRDQTHSRVAAFLTEQQRERYRELQQNPGYMRGNMRPMGRRGDVRGVRAPSLDRAVAFLTSELDLTAEQQTQIRPIMQEHFARRQELFAGAERGVGVPLGMRPEMVQLRDQTHSRVEALLTEQQRERYRELQQNPGYMRGDFGRPARGGRGGGPRR